MRKLALLILGLTITNLGWALECSSVINISSDKGRQGASRAAINGNGTAVIIWIKPQEGNTYRLQACHREHANAPWSASETISEPMNIIGGMPYVTVDGTCTIVWCVPNSMNKQYYYSKKEGVGPWLPGQAIHYPELTDTKDVVVDFTGDPFVLAAHLNESPNYSFHYKYPEMLQTPFRELPKLPKSDEEKALAPQLLTNKDGKIVALWSIFYKAWQKANTNYYFCKSSCDKTGQWGARSYLGNQQLKNFEKDKVKGVSASLNKKDEIAVIWSHYEADAAKYKLKTLINQKTDELKDSQEGFKNPSILMDDDGNTVAVWIQQFNKQNVVYAAFKPKEKDTWQGEAKQLSNISTNAEQVQIGFHQGVFVVVWGEGSETPFKRAIFGATLAPKHENFEWTSAVQLSPVNQNCWHPSIAFGDKGGIITWTAHVKQSTDYHIQAANLTAP